MKGKGKNSEVSFEIEKIYGYLNKKKDKVLVKVSWNGRPAKIELRRCWTDEHGKISLGKGIPIDEDEIEELIELANKLPKPVNFDEVFKSSEGVMDIRKQGLRTVDGFPVLKRRGS